MSFLRRQTSGFNRTLLVILNLLILSVALAGLSGGFAGDAFLLTCVMMVAGLNIAISFVFGRGGFSTQIARDIWTACKYLAVGGNVILIFVLFALGISAAQIRPIILAALLISCATVAWRFDPVNGEVAMPSPVLTQRSRLWDDNVDIRFQQAIIAKSTVFPSYRIYLATFLGGPAAGFWLLSKNYKALRKPGAAFLTFWLGLIVSMVVIEAAPHVLPNVPKGASRYIFAMVDGLCLAMFARFSQDSSIEEALALGARMGSRWFVIWTSIVWTICTIAAVAAISFLRWRLHF